MRVATSLRKTSRQSAWLADALKEIDYTAVDGWTSTPEKTLQRHPVYPNAALESFIKNIHIPCTKGEGDLIPVSALDPRDSCLWAVPPTNIAA